MQIRKIIKKLTQSAVVLLLIVFSLPALAYLLLQSSRIQTIAATAAAKLLSAQAGSEISVGSVDISFLYRVRLNEVLLRDIYGDTLIYSESIIAGIRSVNPISRSISLGSIDFNEAFVNFVSDSADNLNFLYFLDRLKSKEGGKEGGMDLSFSNIRLNDSRFYLISYDQDYLDYGINFSDMRISRLNADLRRFAVSPDSVTFRINSLSLIEASGFRLSDMSCDFTQADTLLKFGNVEITTANTNIMGDMISMSFKNYRMFKPDSLYSEVIFDLRFDRTVLDLYDLSYFAPAFRDARQKFNITGSFSGPLNNMKGSGISLGYGTNSLIKVEISTNGLPKINETFIYANVDEFITSEDDLNSLNLPGNRKIKFPENLHNLGLIKYSGMFTGFIRDFVTFGTLTTDLGVINTDLLFRPDTLNNVGFNGRLAAYDFNIGRMIESENIGVISLAININGYTAADRSLSAMMDGVVNQIGFLGYDYKNIGLSGDLKNRTFNGAISVTDPNIEFEFLGEVDFTDTVPAYDFVANVAHANLYELNIDKSDPDFTSAFLITANAKGKDLNSLNGEIKIENAGFNKADQQLSIKDLTVIAENKPDTNLLTIRSDFIDMDIAGRFEPDMIVNNFRAFLDSYLPSLNNETNDSAALHPVSSLTADLRIKNIQPVLDMFLPGYHLSGNSRLEIDYTKAGEGLRLFFHSSDLGYRGISFKDMSVILSGDEESLLAEAGGSSFMIGKQVGLENFTLISRASGDSINIETRWNNWSDIKYNGQIKALAMIYPYAADSSAAFNISVQPTTFYTNDSLWRISEGTVSVQGKEILIDNIRISHEDQYFSLDGMVSDDPDKSVRLAFNDFNLAALNGLTESAGFKLAGILNGDASFSNLYHNVLFTSELAVDSLALNDELLGNTEINAKWNDAGRAIEIDAFAMRDNLKTIMINGSYSMGTEHAISFDVELDKLRVNLFNPYTKGIFNDMRGIATGGISVRGNTGKPVLNGKINFQKTSLGIDYLNTRYTFSDDIEIVNNNIYFRNLVITDGSANEGTVTGSITSTYLKDFIFDLTIRSDKILCLDTKPTDNDMFYGTAYARDLVFRLTGPVNSLLMDISAGTAENTVISIPLSESRELSEYDFITVIYEDEGLETSSEEIITTVRTSSGLQLNLDLAVTPDAEVQIIFDPKLGDIIKGKGNGDLDMRINTNGEFVMYGTYTIEQGDYLFTLQNFINKKLTIEEGGTIRWSGDPFDATIDIVATYRVKTPLNDLLAISEEVSVTVDDRITMTGRLMAPDIKYDIYLPFENEETRLRVNNAITSSEELNKQFISLLIQQRFIPAERSGLSSGTLAYSNAAGVSAGEFLTNQLSNWLSQISNDFDVGINYRSSPEQRTNEVQVALSTQLFNDKLSINGSVDVPTNAAASNADNIVGEFDIDYKLTRNGKLRIKTYNHVNNVININNSQYTQGLGIFYKEEFTTVKELVRRYWQNLFGIKNEEKKELEEEDISDK